MSERPSRVAELQGATFTKLNLVLVPFGKESNENK